MEKIFVFMKYGAGQWRNSLCMRICFYRFILGCAIVFVSSASLFAEEKREADETWIQIFNGKNLHGWTPKFVGYDLGINFRNTFVVRDGLLTVCYDNYKSWQNNIGHLFYKDEFSHYVLRMEYRFVGRQVKDAPEFSVPNSGLILHGQSAESMSRKQERPASLETKLLGGHRAVQDERENLAINALVSDANTNELEGKHGQGDQWTCVEIEVHGGDVIRHKSGGQLITEYKKPRLSDGSPLVGGTIALQASSHPIQFRKIELKVLDH